MRYKPLRIIAEIYPRPYPEGACYEYQLRLRVFREGQEPVAIENIFTTSFFEDESVFLKIMKNMAHLLQDEINKKTHGEDK